jgi:transcriptional regulator with XRE-family HTH domain
VKGSIPDKVQLGKAIQTLREESGMTSEGLAEAAGVDKAHLNRAENHGRNFTWDTLGLLARALGIPISVLVLKAEEIAGTEGLLNLDGT